MTLLESIRVCFSKYIDFSGRARRSEYWFFILFQVIIDLFLYAFYPYSSSHQSTLFYAWHALYTLVGFAFFLPNLTVSVRRLHDIDKSGWWIFISFIPLVGPFWYLYLLILEGTPESNTYG